MGSANRYRSGNRPIQNNHNNEQKKENNHNSEQKKDSGFVEFSKKPLVIIFTILIALSGGIPGIISTVTFFSQKPDIRFNMGTINSGIITNKGKDYGDFLFYVTLYNNGNKSLVPANFRTYIRYDGVENELYSFKMTDSMKAVSPDRKQTVWVRNAKERDLQYLKKLSPDESIGGLLLYVTTPEIRDAFFKAASRYYKITCVDAFGKDYSSGWVVLAEHTPIPSSYGDSVTIPKEDITISK